MRKALSVLIWLAIALAGAAAYGVIAFHRGEHLNSAYIVIAAACTYALGYRFYSKWIAAKVLTLDDLRATPCEVQEDGRDYVKTNKWIVFGHHFAAISGPGPLVGPVLAAQFGYLPGTLWILIGAVLGGAVQDMVILFCSMRRNGKSLGQMVKDELNSTAGVIGVIAILAIMIILLAVLALVVVKALAHSPWGVFTVAATIPIAMLMGGYLRFLRPGKVMEVSMIGVVLLLLSVWGGQYVHEHETLRTIFKLDELPLAWGVIVYGLMASTLPVWLLLAPRDYLSTFMKLGTILALALGVLLVLPDLQMQPLTKFIDGSGLIVPGSVFPFCFITIACGAISGFHTLISSGITPKIITRESYVRQIGYGAMCLESLVAIMAMIAACTLDPAIYTAINVAGTPDQIAAALKGVGMTIDHGQMVALAKDVGEDTLYGRTGGAATLAVGMAQIFSNVTHGRWLDLWYHFAIMFEALFILTTVDAGTRVGRYLLQDALGHVWKPLGNTKGVWSNAFTSVLIVAMWGFFLIMGVTDPEGGVKALWPLFGIANQLLASVALCLATTIILKMALKPAADGSRRSPAYALVTLLPLIWLLAVTGTAAVQKIGHPNPKIGFLAGAAVQDNRQPQLIKAVEEAKSQDAAALAAAEKALKNSRTIAFNNRVDAVVTAIFLVLVSAIIIISVRDWIQLLRGAREPVLHESEPVWLTSAKEEGSERPISAMGVIAFGLLLLKEISGQSAIEREQIAAEKCDCVEAQTPRGRQNVFLSVTNRQYNSIRRCC